MGSLYIRRRIRATTGVLRQQLQFFDRLPLRKGGRFWFPSASNCPGEGGSSKASRRLFETWGGHRLLPYRNLRHPAGELPRAERPSLCEPATILAPLSVIRRMGFSFGKGLACKFQIFSPVKNDSKPIAHFRKAARGSFGREQSGSRMKADRPLSGYHKVNVPSDRDDS
jgi:hypothetical protein